MKTKTSLFIITTFLLTAFSNSQTIIIGNFSNNGNLNSSLGIGAIVDNTSYTSWNVSTPGTPNQFMSCSGSNLNTGLFGGGSATKGLAVTSDYNSYVFNTNMFSLTAGDLIDFSIDTRYTTVGLDGIDADVNIVNNLGEVVLKLGTLSRGTKNLDTWYIQSFQGIVSQNNASNLQLRINFQTPQDSNSYKDVWLDRVYLGKNTVPEAQTMLLSGFTVILLTGRRRKNNVD